MNSSLPVCHQNLFRLVETGNDKGYLQAPYCVLGTVFAVAAAPDIPLPDVWLPWLIKPELGLPAVPQLTLINDVAMACLQWQLQHMRDDNITLPAAVQYSTQVDSPLALWMQGLLLAHTRLDSVWQTAWRAMLSAQHADVGALQKDLKHCLSVFSTFADISFALQQARDKEQLATSLPRIFVSLPRVLATYVTLSGRLVEYLPNQFETFVKD